MFIDEQQGIWEDAREFEEPCTAGVQLVTDARILRKRVAKPNFYRGNPITDCLTFIHCRAATDLRGLFSARVV